MTIFFKAKEITIITLIMPILPILKIRVKLAIINKKINKLVRVTVQKWNVENATKIKH